ncbi:MAG: hypothetical protein OXI57_04015 [Rhodospirillales bacterium]|nr:hypothetical protein [Rhodospirillales bacterium]
MNRTAAALVIAAGAALACVSIAGEGVSADAPEHALIDKGPAPTPLPLRVADEGDTEEERNRRFNAAFSSEFDRSIALFRGACESNLSPDKQLATVEAGIDALFALVSKYEQKAYELWTRNHILLLTIEDLLYHGMVFTRWGHSLADLVQTEDLSDSFVTYYKYMHNLGDNVEARDFQQKWARDMAEGLACLDR